MRGMVINIQRFCVQDGPGIRTTVFLKGCPLRCAWCHNPESQERGRQILFDEARCARCGACEQACERGCQLAGPLERRFERTDCARCGRCVEVCYAGALEWCGEEMSAETVLDEVRRDRDYYRNTGGGMTLSGGEPLFQADFSEELARRAHAEGIHVCVETSGWCARERLMRLAEAVDLFLYDVKCLDDALHIRYVGQSNRLILENLAALDAAGCETILRCPIIPEVNLTDEHFRGLAALANRLRHVREIQLEPYHPLGAQKAVKLGQTAAYSRAEFLEKSVVREYAERAQPLTDTRFIVQ